MLSSAIWFVVFKAPGKLLPSPKEDVAYPLPKRWLFDLWSSVVQLLLKEAVANQHKYSQQQQQVVIFVQ